MRASLNRREMLQRSAAFAALALIPESLTALGAPETPPEAELIPFLDVQAPGRGLRWDELTSWITPNAKVFNVGHYGVPKPEPPDAWRLEISGLVKHPVTLSLADLKARKSKRIIATLECSGNGSSPGFVGAVGNVEWTGVPLAALLKDCGLRERAIEIVFFGADEKLEKIREKDYLQNFARSLSVGDAQREDVLLAYAMNGEPLSQEHGAPVRLIVPGWFGIAWVKWLKRIEVTDRRFMGKFMARDYVTIRGEERDGQTIWRETSVGPIDVKSICARAVRVKAGVVRFTGAAWSDGTAVERVELQIDNGPWKAARLERKKQARYGWVFWTYDWESAPPGEHTVVSRATDAAGRVQPAAADPAIALKRTYWEANQQFPRKIKL